LQLFSCSIQTLISIPHPYRREYYKAKYRYTVHSNLALPSPQ